MDVENFLPLLKAALDNVPQNYYRHELWRNRYWHQIFEANSDQANLRELRDYLDRYGERVFCYELYHQVRVLMEQHYRKNSISEDDDVLFQAELKKDQLQDVSQCFSDQVNPLKKAYIPDFLLHAPGSFQHQELIIEVKSNPVISSSDIKDDLLKLHEFIVSYQHRMGLFLTVNTHPRRIIHLIKELIESNPIEEILPYREKILILCKPGQNEPLQEWCLVDL